MSGARSANSRSTCQTLPARAALKKSALKAGFEGQTPIPPAVPPLAGRPNSALRLQGSCSASQYSRSNKRLSAHRTHDMESPSRGPSGEDDAAVEMGEVFAFFDDDRDGNLNVDQFIGVSRRVLDAPASVHPPAAGCRHAAFRSAVLGHVSQAVRSLGHAPTESDVAMFSRTVEKRYDGFLSLQEFVNVMTGVVIPRLCKAKDAATEINHAFKVRACGPARSLPVPASPSLVPAAIVCPSPPLTQTAASAVAGVLGRHAWR